MAEHGIDRRSFLGSAAAAAFVPHLSIGNHGPHHTPRANRVVHICLCGALSHVDSFDYKPALRKYHGTKMPVDERPDVFFGKVGLLRQPDWGFRQHGECGRWVSDLFPYLGEVVDQLTFVHSMYAETSNHTPATFQENTGFRLNGFPVIGAWLSYGLGSAANDLPGYVVIPDVRGFPAGGTINWTNGFLPAEHQGVVIRSDGTPVDDLFPATVIGEDAERATRELIRTLNTHHLRDRRDDVLAARMASYALADRMQRAIPEVANLDTEPESIRTMYGLDREVTAPFGRSALLARRLLERGVRMVQLFSGGSFGNPRINWDGHENVVRNHGREAPRIDQPVAALLRDLAQRGMLDDTLVMFTTEFGRTPFTESADDVVGTGRDHNQYGFTVWLAGAGLKPGISYGATDDFGYQAVENPVHWHDFHATILHLLGIDHERLTYYHNGIERRLTNVHGNVIRDLLA